MTLRGLAAGAAATIGLAAAAAPAHATDFFATTDETALTQDCRTAQTACALGRAMREIPQVLPITTPPVGVHRLVLVSDRYDIADVNAGALPGTLGTLFVKRGLTIEGLPGTTPVLDSTGSTPLDAGIDLESGGVLRGLRIERSSAGNAINVQGHEATPSSAAVPAKLDRISVAVNAAAGGVLVRANGTIANSRIHHGGTSTADVALTVIANATPSRVIATTVTAATGSAISVYGPATSATARASFVNTVARGAAADFAGQAETSGTPGPGTTVDASHSAWRTAPPFFTSSGNFAVSATTPIVTADPLLDADGKPGAGSPLIDAGSDPSELGQLDLPGNARVAGSAPDIGAYEFGSGPPVVPCPPGGADPECRIPVGTGPEERTSQPGSPVTPVAPKDTTGPIATLTTPKTLKRSKLTKKKGIAFVAKLDEAAPTATLELVQITKAKGKKPAKEKVLATATRTGTGTTLTFALKAKPSKVGKKGKLKLTLRFTFVDAAGNRTVVERPVTVS